MRARQIVRRYSSRVAVTALHAPSHGIGAPNEPSVRLDPTVVCRFEDLTQDPGQRTAADSTHGALVARAEQALDAHAPERVSVAPRDPAKDPAYDPVRNPYKELLDRRAAIPTTGQ